MKITMMSKMMGPFIRRIEPFGAYHGEVPHSKYRRLFQSTGHHEEVLDSKYRRLFESIGRHGTQTYQVTVEQVLEVYPYATFLRPRPREVSKLILYLVPLLPDEELSDLDRGGSHELARLPYGHSSWSIGKYCCRMAEVRVYSHYVPASPQ